MGVLGAASSSTGLARLLRPFTGLAFRRGQRMVLQLLRLVLGGLLFVGIALATGLGSAWYALDVGLPFTVESTGPWRSWPSFGHPSADPYSWGHAVRAGHLPLSSTAARYFTATHDSDGSRLYGDCEYAIVGRGPPAAWWSLAVYDRGGALIPSTSGRYSVSSETLVREPSGRFSIRMAADTRQGNWLPVAGSEAVVLVMRAYVPDRYARAVDTADSLADVMPTIRRIECR
jgi:hypothetical protein